MRSKVLLSVLILLYIFILAPTPGPAQSTLEYSTLISSVSAAAEKAGSQNVKEEAKNVYNQAGQSMSKGASLLGRAGGGTQVPASDTPQATKAEAANKTRQETKAGGQKPARQAVKVYLKNGSVIEGDIIEQKDDYTKVDTQGIPVTYFNEEIDKIEEAS